MYMGSEAIPVSFSFRSTVLTCWRVQPRSDELRGSLYEMANTRFCSFTRLGLPVGASALIPGRVVFLGSGEIRWCSPSMTVRPRGRPSSLRANLAAGVGGRKRTSTSRDLECCSRSTMSSWMLRFSLTRLRRHNCAMQCGLLEASSSLSLVECMSFSVVKCWRQHCWLACLNFTSYRVSLVRTRFSFMKHGWTDFVRLLYP